MPGDDGGWGIQAEICNSAPSSSPHPRSSRCPLPLQVARPGRGSGPLPTVLPVVMLPLAPHPCGRPAPTSACRIALPLSPRVRTHGSPEGGTEGPTDGGSSQQSQAGRPKPVRPALAERLPRTDWTTERREGEREGGEGRAGRQLLPSLTRRPI